MGEKVYRLYNVCVRGHIHLVEPKRWRIITERDREH